MDTQKMKMHVPCIVLAALAVVVIAACGWCAGVYASGGDPFGFLSSAAFTTTAEPDARKADANEQRTVVLTVDDVRAALSELAFDGEDVSVDAEAADANVVLQDGGIWVEARDGAAASELVDTAVRRASALAMWAAGEDADIDRVTWIAETEGGAVAAALTMPVSSAPEAGTAAELLAACTGYRISGDVFAEFGDGIEQVAGGAPVLPDGTEVPVTLEQTPEDEGAQTEAARTERLVTGGGAASQGEQSAERLITVSVTVDGSAAGAGSSSARVSVVPGASAYDALMACGVSVNAQSSAYGMYVSAIGGLAEKEHGSMSGWIYTVNGSEPSVSCSSYTLNDGDTVVWRYVNVEG